VAYCGFEVEVSFTANVHDDIPAGALSMDVLRDALGSTLHREHDLGQYLMTRWRKVSACGTKRPGWLYRSYPSEQLA
jgi:hypothetical protein